MKSITLTLLTVICLNQLSPSAAGSLYVEKNDAYRCDYLKLGTLEIKDNPFVKPGKRDNKNVWYKSVNWTRIPPGQVIMTTEITLHEWGRKSRVPSREPFDLFLSELRTTDGSLANLMRMALGIPRGSNPVLGETELDPLMFSEKPCTVFYLNAFPYYHQHQYTYDFTVTAKAGGKGHKLISGTLIKPDK